MRPYKKIILYGIFTLIVVVFFLYVRFPAEVVRDMLVERITATQPQVEILTDQAAPVFPPGVKFSPLTVVYADLPVLSADYLKVSPALLSLFGNQKKFVFKGILGSGNFKGRVHLSTDNDRPQAKIVANLTQIPLELLEIIDHWPAFQPDGLLTAYIDFDNRKGAGGTTSVTMDITPARIILDPPAVGLEQLEFSQVQGEIGITPRMLQIKRLEANGDQIEAKVTGSIIFRQPLGSSRITLSCTVKPRAAFIAEHKNDIVGGFLASSATQKRGLVFRISGTLDNPRYVMR